MIPEAHDVCLNCFHLNLCASGHSEPAQIQAEEEGGAGETAADLLRPQLQGHLLRRAGGLLQELHQDLPGQLSQQGQVSAALRACTWAGSPSSTPGLRWAALASIPSPELLVFFDTGCEGFLLLVSLCSNSVLGPTSGRILKDFHPWA